MDGNQVLYDHDKNYSLFLLNTFLTNTNLINFIYPNLDNFNSYKKN